MPPRRNKLPVPLPEGLILTDINKKSWRLGKKLGQGGFGLIYLASPDCDVTVPDDAAYVIKVENFQNGPLFCELKFYQRAAKQNDVKKWIGSRNLDYLGIPRYWGTGETNYQSSSYRFMVVDRLGMDLHKLQSDNSGRLLAKSVMQIGIRMLDVLEYIHKHEYVHGDIKAGNILLHTLDTSKVYLADYGLSYRYCPNGKHKEYKEDPRKCHNGTIEFTSRDAHKGVAPSRRGDLEILAYCMLHWLSGKLPWGQSLRDPSTVLTSKTKFWKDLPDSVTEWCGGEDECQALAKFMAEVSLLTYYEEPNYAALKRILMKPLDSTGTSLSSPLINSDVRSFQKLSTGVRKKPDKWKPVTKRTEDEQTENSDPLKPCFSPKTTKNYSKRTAVYPPTSDDSDDYDSHCAIRTMPDASSKSPKTIHAEVSSEAPSFRKPMNYSKRKAVYPSPNDNSDECDSNHPSRNSQKTIHADLFSEAPSFRKPRNDSKKTTEYPSTSDDSDGYHAELYSNVPSTRKPIRELNTCATQHYKVAADNSPLSPDPINDLKRRATSLNEPDLHRQYRQDIYKYGFAVPVLLLMIYYVIYVL